MNHQFLKTQDKIKNLYLNKNLIAIYEPHNISVKRDLKDNFIKNLNENLGNDYVISKLSKPLNDFIIKLLSITSKQFKENKEKYLPYIKNIASNIKKIDKNIFLNKFISDTFFEEKMIIRDVKFSPEDYFLTRVKAIKILIKSNIYNEEDYNQSLYKSSKFDIVVDLDENINYESIAKKINNIFYNKSNPIKNNKMRKRNLYNIIEIKDNNKKVIKTELTISKAKEFLNSNIKKNLTYERAS